MSEKKLETFKVGETQKPTVKVRQQDKEAVRQAQSDASSVGFRRIELILEQETKQSVATKLHGIRQLLEAFAEQSSTNRDKAAAKKAMIAVERAGDLVNYLFEVKDSMVQ